MPMLTIVDKDDNVLGSERYSVVYKEGKIHRFVRIMIFNNHDEVLLQFRGAKSDTMQGTWDQSVGGHVDAGEDYETAAYRELEEELGVKDVELELLGKFYTEGQIGEKNIKRFNAVFKATYSGDFTLQEEEVDSVKWFKLEDLKKEIEQNPEGFTLGLRTVLKDYVWEITV